MKNENIKFLIDHIDPLGQGVSKSEDKITFIHKVLPGEQGVASIYKRKKGVSFASISANINCKITNKSPHRIVPKCLHFNKCTSCHFLHTNYDSELQFKKNTFKKYCAKLGAQYKSFDNINIHRAKNRFNYRNRVQLHYDVDKNILGNLSNIDSSIVEIPNCLLGNDSVKKGMQELYNPSSDLYWRKLVHQNHHAKKGHIEIYDRPDYINTNKLPQISINKQYSDGGFHQVNDFMHQILLQIIQKNFNKISQEYKYNNLLELFGGSGNLSFNLDVKQKIIVDLYEDKNLPNNFINMNLYKKNSSLKLKKILEGIGPIDILILDPPRSGLKNLNEFLNLFNPRDIYYISCNISTAISNIYPTLDRYNIKSMHLIDLFPGTFHFETLIHLQKS